MKDVVGGGETQEKGNLLTETRDTRPFEKLLAAVGWGLCTAFPSIVWTLLPRSTSQCAPPPPLFPWNDKPKDQSSTAPPAETAPNPFPGLGNSSTFQL